MQIKLRGESPPPVCHCGHRIPPVEWPARMDVQAADHRNEYWWIEKCGVWGLRCALAGAVVGLAWITFGGR